MALLDLARGGRGKLQSNLRRIQNNTIPHFSFILGGQLAAETTATQTQQTAYLGNLRDIQKAGGGSLLCFTPVCYKVEELVRLDVDKQLLGEAWANEDGDHRDVLVYFASKS